MRHRSKQPSYSVAVAALILIAAACGSGEADVATTTAVTAVTTTTVPLGGALPEPELTVEESVVEVNGAEIPRADPTSIEIQDEIALGEGALAFLRLGDQLVFELLKETNLRLESVETGSIEAFLERGHLRFTVEDQMDAQLQLTTPNSVLKTLQSGTQFTFCQAPTGAICVSVSRGAVEITKAGRTETYVGGESSYAGPDDPLGPPICVPEDAFDAWFEASRRNEDPRTLTELVRDHTPCDGATAETVSQSAMVIVPGAVQWTDTELDVEQGNIVDIEAGGAVALAVGRAVADPDGDLDVEVRRSNLAGLEDVNHGLLVGRIGEAGVPFVVGRAALFKAPEDGRLYLGINDVGLENNSGEFVALVTVLVP